MTSFSFPGKFHIEKDDSTEKNPYPKSYCGLSYHHHFHDEVVSRNGWNNQVSKETILHNRAIICKICFCAHMKVLDKRARKPVMSEARDKNARRR